MNYKISEKEAFKVVGTCREFSCNGANAGIPGVPAFWGEANADGTVSRLAGLQTGVTKGLFGITANFDGSKNTVDYWIAAEFSGQAPPGFKVLEFPAAKWAIFEVIGPIPAAMIQTWEKIYSAWFPSTDYRPANLPCVELYLDADPKSQNPINEIWVAIQ